MKITLETLIDTYGERPIPTVITHLNGGIIHANDALVSLMGSAPRADATFCEWLRDIGVDDDCENMVLGIYKTVVDTSNGHVSGNLTIRRDSKPVYLIITAFVQAFDGSQSGPVIVMSCVENPDMGILESSSCFKKKLNTEINNNRMMYRFFRKPIDGIMLIDGNGVIVAWNDSMERLTGLARDDVMGTNVWDIQHTLLPESHKKRNNPDAIRALVQDALHTSTNDEYCQQKTFEIIGADGKKVVISKSIVPMTVGNATFFAGIFTNITDSIRHENHHKALLMLREHVLCMNSTDDLEGVLEAIGRALDKAEISYKVIEINVIEHDTTPSIRAYEIRPTTGWRTYRIPDDIEVVLNFWRNGRVVYRKDLNEEDVYSERDLIVGQYGAVRSVIDIPFSHGTLAVNSEHSNAFSEMDIDFLREITQILAEGFRRIDDIRKLVLSERRYRNIIELPDDMIVALTTPAGVITYASPQLEQLTGYSPEVLIKEKMTFDGFIFPDDLKTFKASMNNALSGLIKKNVTVRMRKSNGQYAWLSCTTIPFTAPEDQSDMIQLVLYDITTRKKADERIRNSLAEKEILLREIHHRVKNNLQVISSLLMLQVDRIKDPEYAEIFSESINRIHAMALIHTMLYESENLSVIDFNDYIKNVCSNLGHLYRHTASHVGLNIETHGISLKVDIAIPCGLIINELVSNSFKYAFREGVVGMVSVTLEEAADDTILLRVADDGTGLSSDVNWRDSESLGLKIVNLLATKQLGGTINMDNAKGTVFTITFKR